MGIVHFRGQVTQTYLDICTVLSSIVATVYLLAPANIIKRHN